MEQSEIRRIGRILKERRLQLGYTQEYAAEKAGISYSYYTKIERGQQLPSLEVAMLLSKTFNLSMDRWLLSQAHDYRMSPAWILVPDSGNAQTEDHIESDQAV